MCKLNGAIKIRMKEFSFSLFFSSLASAPPALHIKVFKDIKPFLLVCSWTKKIKLWQNERFEMIYRGTLKCSHTPLKFIMLKSLYTYVMAGVLRLCATI